MAAHNSIKTMTKETVRMWEICVVFAQTRTHTHTHRSPYTCKQKKFWEFLGASLVPVSPLTPARSLAPWIWGLSHSTTRFHGNWIRCCTISWCERSLRMLRLVRTTSEQHHHRHNGQCSFTMEEMLLSRRPISSRTVASWFRFPCGKCRASHRSRMTPVGLLLVAK